MAGIKLDRLPDRTPVKMTIAISPELNQLLIDYAEAYAATYARSEPVAELVPAILNSFLQGDRAFVRARRSRGAPA